MGLIAIDPAAFGDPVAFTEEITRACTAIRDSPPAAGIDRVLLAGDVERAARTLRSAGGIPVPPEVWQQVATLAGQLSVVLP